MPLVGNVAPVSNVFKCPRSMLDWEPLETEEPSEDERGGVSTPELAVVTVLERDLLAGPGRENTLDDSTARCIALAIEYYQREKPTRRQNILAMGNESALFETLPFQKTLACFDHTLRAELVGRR